MKKHHFALFLHFSFSLNNCENVHIILRNDVSKKRQGITPLYYSFNLILNL